VSSLRLSAQIAIAKAQPTKTKGIINVMEKHPIPSLFGLRAV
jgi:ureidoglycolate hydrolase